MARIPSVSDIEVLRMIGENGASTEMIRGACKFMSMQGARVRVRKLVQKGLALEKRERRGKVMTLRFMLSDEGRCLLLEPIPA